MLFSSDERFCDAFSAIRHLNPHPLTCKPGESTGHHVQNARYSGVNEVQVQPVGYGMDRYRSLFIIHAISHAWLLSLNLRGRVVQHS